MNPEHSRVCEGKLVLRQSVPHFSQNSGAMHVQCSVVRALPRLQSNKMKILSTYEYTVGMRKSEKERET